MLPPGSQRRLLPVVPGVGIETPHDQPGRGIVQLGRVRAAAARAFAYIARVRFAEVEQTAELAWVARVGELVVGRATAHPGSEPSARFVRLTVDPPYRRRGIGRGLFEAACVGLQRSGCVVLEAIAVVGTDGEAFARRLGARAGDELADDVLTLATLDLQHLRQLCALPPGYVVAHWVGSAPDDLVESYARAKCSIADAPNQHPPSVPDWNTDLVRAGERARADRGAVWVEVAVLAETRTVVALTEVEIAGDCEVASQNDTVVLPGHRRKGLATAVKADLLLRLCAARPDLVSIGVTCAVANCGMRAVNHRLGFREERRRTLYRLRLPVRLAERDGPHGTDRRAAAEGALGPLEL